MSELRTKIKQVIFFIALSIIALLLLRLIIDLFGLTNKNEFFKFIAAITDIFIVPFEGIVAQNISRELVFIHFDIFIAIGFYIILAIILAELLSLFLQDSSRAFILYLVDFLFKLVESIIILRIILDFFLIKSSSGIISFILIITEWTHSISATTFFDNRIFIGTIGVLLLVGFLDYLSDLLIKKQEVHIQPSKREVTEYKPIR